MVEKRGFQPWARAINYTYEAFAKPEEAMPYTYTDFPAPERVKMEFSFADNPASAKFIPFDADANRIQDAPFPLSKASCFRTSRKLFPAFLNFFHPWIPSRNLQPPSYAPFTTVASQTLFPFVLSDPWAWTLALCFALVFLFAARKNLRF